jgi:uncharacterized protein (TIGR02646 family)
VVFWREAAAFETLHVVVRKTNKFKSYAKSTLPPPDHEFPAVWRSDNSLKEALSAMSDGHCAYCQASVADAGPGAVEHFRPKSLFPTLAYEWDNYFYSCERCNIFKSDKWPDDGEYVRPDEGDPASRFVFTRRGRVRAAPRDPAARNTVRDLNLNRSHLAQQRRNAMRKGLQMIHYLANATGISQARQHELAAMQIVEPLARFSAAINQNVRRAWGQAFPTLKI